MQLLLGKHALITGGSGGIGREICAQFLKQGARISIIARDERHGEEALKELRDVEGADAPCAFYLADVTDTEQMHSALAKIEQDGGAVDIAVNNAGIKADNLLLKMSEDDWDSVIAVNLKSIFTVCKSVIRTMIKKRRGSIVNISSVGGLAGNPGQCNYSAAKAGVLGFTKTLAREVGKRGVRVNALCPGFIDTPMTQSLKSETLQKILDNVPMNRMGTAREIGHAAVFLASDWASYVTGQTLVVDGGLIA